MSFRFRPAVVVPAVVAAVLAVAYSVYWFHVAGEIRKGFEQWRDDRRAAGWTVDGHGPVVSGFPGAIHLNLEAPRLAAPGGFAWHGPRLSARVSPFDLTRVRLDLAGRHKLTVAGTEMGIDAVSLDLMIHLTRDGSLDDATLTTTGTQVVAAGFGRLEVASLAATLDPLEVPMPGHDTPTVVVAAAAQGIELPAIPGLVLDRQIGLVDIKARVLGPIPTAAPADAVARWSADGGVVELDRVALDWAPLGLEGEGTLALDPHLQPLAALSARVRGYGEFMDRLARSGVIEPGPANAAKVFLGLMAKPDPRGRPALPVPVTVQDGWLSIGPARVLSVPPLAWPAEHR
ncbi:MAG: DUF2125 domain-containing protein [Actinomycetota bacterium]